MAKIKKFDIHLTNVTGLGAVKLVSSLLPSFVSLYSSLIGKVYLPSSGELSSFKVNKNVATSKYKRYLPNSLSRFLEIVFWRPKEVSETIIVLGDIPLSMSRNQVVFLHSTLIVEDLIEHNFWQRLKYKLLRSLFVLNISKVTAVIVQTELMKALVLNKYPKLFGKTYVVNQPPPEIFIQHKNVRTKPKVAKHLKSISLFYPSAFYAHKNHIYLSELSSNNQKIKELILTIDPSCNPAPNSTFIKCVGNINIKDALAYYLEVDALAFLSLTESYGLPLIEAMWLGLPILAPDLPYARSLCGNEAIYFGINDPKSFEKAVDLLIDKLNSGWYPDWSERLKNIPSSWDDVATQILSVAELGY